jgi:predicted esterase
MNPGIKGAGMIKTRRFFVALAALLLMASSATTAMAQARMNLALTRVIYLSMKSQAKPQGELKTKIDALDKDIAEAARAGRSGEVRRLLAKGMAFLAGRPWTDELEFSNSLILRADEIYVDSSRPFAIRVEQIYAPQILLADSLTVRVSLHTPERAALGVRAGEKLKDLAAQDGVSRDFLDEPCRVELDLSDIEDGTYLLRAEILEKEKSLGAATLLVDLRKGLTERLRSLETELKKINGFDAVRPDVLYPLDFIRNVNRGRVEMGTFQIVPELKAAEETLASIKAGKDPFAGRTGDMERHYLLEGANEIMPYRVYVPKTYDGRAAFPLIIALHGLGATQDSFFDSYGKEFPKLAEEHGYIVAAPLGYRVDGAYGRVLFGNPENPMVARKLDFSEKDVMNVLALMRKNYKIDESRIYLTGHSMGAIGTWYLGAKYPEIWAALAPFSGSANPSTVAAMKRIPEIIVHGDADATVPVLASRAMVAEMKKQGVEHVYIEVPGGNHLNVVTPNFAAVFDFFDKHRKKTS